MSKPGQKIGLFGPQLRIVFERDRGIFEEEFLCLRLKSVIPHTPFRYILSGGVSFRSLMPVHLFGVWSRFEELIEPWMKYLAMFATITLVRTNSPDEV